MSGSTGPRGLVEALHASPARLAAKFAACFTLVTLLALFFLGLTLARREAADLRATVLADLRSQGRTLAPTVRDVWLRDGLARARSAVEAANRETDTVRLSLEPSEAGAGAGHEVVRVEVPIRTPEGLQFLRLERAAPGLSEAIRGELSALLLASLLAACGIIAVSYALCEWLVASPLRRVAAQARRIAGGELSERMAERGSAEIASLKREVNAMAGALDAARRCTAAETERRLAATEALRHADRLKTVGTLAAGIAHELGTPLNVVLILARRLQREARRERDVESGAKEIETQVKRMSTITRQLLDFARRREPQRQIVSLGDLVGRVSQMLDALARARSCSIALYKVHPDLVVSADPVALQQALTNLVVNALDAMPNGGTVALRLRNSEEERTVAIDVEDDGHGMPTDVLDRIFEPFFTTKDVGKGTGLGLCVTHGIVADHGGRLEVASATGRGTVVSILLPAIAGGAKGAVTGGGSPTSHMLAWQERSASAKPPTSAHRVR